MGSVARKKALPLPPAEWIARQIKEAFPWDDAPKYLIRDRDQIYGAVVTSRLRAMSIRDKPTAPASPWQNGFAERLIGSIRRECVDHFVVLGEAHLRRTLVAFTEHYHRERNHQGLQDRLITPDPTGPPRGVIRCRPRLGGLLRYYYRAG